MTGGDWVLAFFIGAYVLVHGLDWWMKREARKRAAAEVFAHPLAPMERQRAERTAWQEEQTPTWQRDAERRAVAERITPTERARWDEADRRYLESLANTFARGIQ